jgi:hypothetical protein
MTILQTPPLPSDIPPSAESSEGYCSDHGWYAHCPDCGCPWCSIEWTGRGECETCDDLTTPWTPPGLCPRGEDCPICPDCGVPGLPGTGVVTCACVAELCSQCWRCPVHARRPVNASPGYCSACTDRYTELGRQWCPGHGWVTPCFAHGTCPDRWEEEDSSIWDPPACSLRPSREFNNRRCRFCEGGGPCNCCHPHCPCCWAERVLQHQSQIRFHVSPPLPCPSCAFLIANDPALTAAVLSNRILFPISVDAS